ncbi:phage tail tape measure protein [Lysinibacillus sphaericus]|uniref:phage tail tape measure protein n=1 Tax=Lysinibacillus sphaericus TaxID=1421 RepID=UPI0018CF5B4D|nr:phage tail tape measure protein [Lysinibacillus sphaericus]
MSRTFETTVQINGAIGSSLTSSFRGATSRLNDLSSRARAIQQEMNRLGRDFRQGTIHQSQYAESTARLSRELRQLENSQRRITALKSTFNNGMNTTKTVASVAAVGVAATATGIAMSSLNTAGNFQQQMSKVSAISGATGTDLTRLDDTAQNLGKSTVFSATQAAEGMEYLALAGWKTDAIISAMPGMLNLAAAGAMDLGRAADITSDTMQAFSMGADKAGHAADVFAYAQANANTNVEMIGEAMKYAAPTANQFKWSLEETSAAMMALANQGLKGSVAGQAFASSMGRLAEDKGKIAEKTKKLGMEFFDAQGKMKSLPSLIKEIEKGTAGMSDKQRVSTLQTLFGAEAFKHWAILLSTGSDELQKMTTALEKSDGTAAKMSATMVDNYAGSLQLLKSSIEGAQIKFMKPVLPVFQKFFDGITGNLDQNMGSIEKAGKATAKILSDITAPFSTSKPIKPKIEPNMDPQDAQKAINQYNKELQKYELFSNMDVGEKVEYMLNTAIKKVETWLSGSGGEAMGRIFTQLGTIAGKAWIAGLTGAASGAVSSALDGNFSGALGLGAAAWMMGGGTLVKGAIGAGRWGKDLYKSRRSANQTPPTTTATSSPAPSNSGSNGGSMGPSQTGTITSYGGGNRPTTATASPAPSNNSSMGPSQTGTVTPYGGGNRQTTATTSPAPSRTGSVTPPRSTPTTPAPVATTPPRTGGMWSKISKAGGRAMLPLSLAMDAYSIYKSNDKVKATGETAGGLAGGLGGAKLGAAIGTAIAPGIGTAVGGLLGGAVGYVGGRWFGGKAVDTVRGSSEPKTAAVSKSEPTPSKAPSTSADAKKGLDTTALNTSATKLATTFETTSTAITAMSTNAKLVDTNMMQLATGVGLASTTVGTSFMSLQNSASITAANMGNLTMYTGQVSTSFVTSFYSLKLATDQSTSNMSTLAAVIANAASLFNSMQGIQTATQNVIAELNNLASRVKNASVPGGTPSRRTQYE